MKNLGPARTGAAPAMILAFWAIGILASISHAPAAGGEKGDWDIGIYAGFGRLEIYPISREIELISSRASLGGLRCGYWLTDALSLESSTQLATAGIDRPIGGPDLDILSSRLNLLYVMGRNEDLRPYVSVGVGHEKMDHPLTSNGELGFNAGAGLRWPTGRHWSMRAEARLIRFKNAAPPEDYQSNLELTLGIGYAFGGDWPKDEDGDGVRNRLDRCPATEQGMRVDGSGCPQDLDGDGVTMERDACPDTPPGYSVDRRGCPVDSDGDGVNDARDECPGTPARAVVDERGCPVDSDGDGVLDSLDICPATPASAVVDERGCPLDDDQDGVLDGIDACPATPVGYRVDETGCATDSDGDGVADTPDRCPDTLPGSKVDGTGCAVLFEKPEEPLILEGAQFLFDEANLLTGSYSVLDRVVRGLQNWPEIRIEIAGHTDVRGTEKHNLDLSRRRAEAVFHYLVSRGIDPGRLEVKGYGETRPLDPGDSENAHGKNRRVELVKIME